MGPKDWETEIANMANVAASGGNVGGGSTGRRGGSSSSSSSATVVGPMGGTGGGVASLQPPPAHQHISSLSRQSTGQFNKPAVPPLKTPPPSMGAPIDLSSRYATRAYI